MATRKKVAKRKPALKSAPKRRTRSKPLAVSEPVRREAITPATFDRQIALVRAMAAWSPVSILVGQQAAFWRGVAEHAVDATSSSPRRRRQQPSKADRSRP